MAIRRPKSDFRSTSLMDSGEMSAISRVMPRIPILSVVGNQRVLILLEAMTMSSRGDKTRRLQVDNHLTKLAIIKSKESV